jgi:hypothetical protein
MAPDEPDLSSCLRQLLDALRRKSADLAADLHPAWLEQGLQRLGLPRDPSMANSPRCAGALATFFRVEWPPLDRFALPAHRLALLPRQDMLRVLGAIELHAERDRVRLSIGGGLRATLIERLGESAYRSLVGSPSLRRSPSGPLSAAELDADRLAWRGLDRLASTGAWRSRRLMRRARLALEPPRGKPARGAARGAAPPEILQHLSSYFPEHAWLFGSPMDRALSASTTA